MALRWLAHPVSLVAVGIMALNDHVLKQAYGSWWTGKLSDVAGLIFFPAVIAVVFVAVRPKRGATGSTRGTFEGRAFERLVLAAVVVTGVGFTWVKATDEGAAAASALLTAIAGPLFGGSSVVLKDATDLLALPALGLAVWSARASALAVRGRRERARRAVGVVMLPVALLASVATTSPQEPRPGIVADDAGTWFWHADHSFGSEGDPYYTFTGDGWELFYEYSSAEPMHFAPDANRPQWEDCVPSDPTVCFRIVQRNAGIEASGNTGIEASGNTGVEMSNDAGETWKVDWALTDDERATLSDAYGVPALDVRTSGVGVVETRHGFVVVASNGRDGFAVRRVDGVWKRVGFEGMDCCDSLAVVDFDTVNALPHPRPLPLGWTMGVVFSALGLPLLAHVLRRGRVSRTGAYAPRSGVFLYVLAVIFGINVLGRNMERAPLAGDDLVPIAGTCVILGVFCVMAALAATASFGLLRVGALWATALGSVLGVLVVGVVTEVVPLVTDDQAVIGFLPLPVFLALYVPVARRLLVRGG